MLWTYKFKRGQRHVDFHSRRVESSDEVFVLKGKGAKEIYDNMLVTLGDEGPSYATVKNWIARFKTEQFSTEDERPTPVEVASGENADAVHDRILAHQ